MSSRARLAVVVLLTALLTPACAVNARSGRTFTAPGPAPAARPGGVLRVALPRTNSADPALATSGYQTVISSLVCEPLVAIDPGTGELKPLLADFWFVAENGRAITIRVKKGVRGPDGRELKARDVQFSLSRLINPYWLSPVGQFFAPLIQGGRQLLDGTASETGPGADASGIRLAGDPYALEIRLAMPLPDMIRFLANPLTGIVSREGTLDDLAAAESDPSCFGPYRLAEPFRPDQTVVRLLKNPNYHGRALDRTRGGRGWPDEIHVHLVGDTVRGSTVGDAPLEAFRAGTVDVAPVRTTDVDTAAAIGDVRFGLAPDVEHVALPTAVPLFRDAEVRRALSLAVDRDALAARFGDSRRPAKGNAPSIFGELYDVRRECRSITEEPDEVERLLVEARRALGGRSVPLYFNDEGTNRIVVEEVARAWRERVGLESVPTAVSWEELVTRASTGSGLDGPVRFTSSTGFVPSPADAVETLLRPVAAFGGGNFARLTNTSLSRYLRRGAQVIEDDDRLVFYGEADKRLCDLAPTAPLLENRSRFVLRRGIVTPARRDGAVSTFDGTPLLSELAVLG